VQGLADIEEVYSIYPLYETVKKGLVEILIQKIILVYIYI
jgi:hypothetical protein